MAGSRSALVVANDTYADEGLRRLTAPHHDADALAEVLGDPALGGFDVQVLSNATAQETRLTVEDFFADRSREDLLLLHFSGHGLKNAAGELFLAVADTQPQRLASTAVAADFLNRLMAESRAAGVALFLDCCYGGAFPRGMVVRAGPEAQVRDAFAGQERVLGGRGRVVVTASSAIEYAFEGGELTPGASGSPSVFTEAVVEAIRTGEADADHDGWVGLHELYDYVAHRVHRATPHQTPHLWSFGTQGELLIARSRVHRVVPTALEPEVAEALGSPLAAARFGVADLFHQRVLGEDLGQAATAWTALEQLVEDDSRRVAEAAAAALDEARLRVSADSVELDGEGRAAFTLAGPPVAHAASVSAAPAWLHVEYDDPVVRVTGTPPEGDPDTAVVTVRTPVETVVVPVQRRGEPAPLPAPTRRARRDPEPGRVDRSPRAVEPAAQVDSAPVRVARDRGDRRVPGTRVHLPFLEALLVLAAIPLCVANRPGNPGQFKIFSDGDSGWYAYRSWHDAYVLSCALLLAAAVVAVVVALARRAVVGTALPRRVALGVVAGAAVFLADDGFTYLVLGFVGDQRGRWTATTLLAVAALVAVASAVRPRLVPASRPGPALWVMCALAAGLSVWNELIGLPDGGSSAVHVFGPVVLLGHLVTLGLVVAALTASDLRDRAFWTAAASTMTIVFLYSTYEWQQSDAFVDHAAVMLPATLLYLGAMAWRLRASSSHLDPAEVTA